MKNRKVCDTVCNPSSWDARTGKSLGSEVSQPNLLNYTSGQWKTLTPSKRKQDGTTLKVVHTHARTHKNRNLDPNIVSQQKT